MEDAYYESRVYTVIIAIRNINKLKNMELGLNN